MKLYNQLTRNVDTFSPLKPGKVSIYSCGPTVYDHAHIGNLSAFVFADTLRRALRLNGYEVRHAMNYTDVDDKTIRRSREQYATEPAEVALQKLTTTYIDIFHQDMRRLGNDLEALVFLRATDAIDAMQALITALVEKGIAYLADDGIYFSIQAYRDSGKQYGQLVELTDQNTSAARIQHDEYDKDNAHDFALWKKQKDGEPSWPFVVSGHDMRGRPGWHIECSAMSRELLGQPFDIHTGGIDLAFPHHENEIAQSTALEDNSVMATFFTHNDHLLVDGKKMSKSLQNFYTLEDIVKKGFDPLAFRVMLLQGHYRNQGNFTWENLEGAQNRLRKWRAMADLAFQPVVVDEADMPAIWQEIFANQPQQFIAQHLADDLNTGMAITWLDRLTDEVQFVPNIERYQTAFTALMQFLDDAFGLDLSKAPTPDKLETIAQLIAKRQAARQAKQFHEADKLRDELEAQGILVRDTPHGPMWQRA